MSLGTEEPTLTEETDDLSSVKSDDQSSVKSDDSSGSNRLKFLYSYGGRILPRPGDGKLRYLGGETRVMAAIRSISFADLMSKLGEIMGCSVGLKCQLPTEDLDALVSIKSDEDLENMLEEYDRLGAKDVSSKVRAFLFPKPGGPLKPTGATGHMAVRAGGGNAEPEPERAMGLCLDEVANGYVASSIPSEFYRLPQESLSNHNLAPFPFGPRGSHPHPNQQQQYVRDMALKAGRPPRCPPVNPDPQYTSPVRYAIRSATQIHDRVKMPRQPKPAAYVDDGHYLRCARMVYSGNSNYQYIPSPPTAAQVQIPGTAPKVPEEYSKKPSNYFLHDPYHGGGLGGFRSQEHFLVQH